MNCLRGCETNVCILFQIWGGGDEGVLNKKTSNQEFNTRDF
jgi:hypothetical protein